MPTVDHPTTVAGMRMIAGYSCPVYAHEGMAPPLADVVACERQAVTAALDALAAEVERMYAPIDKHVPRAAVLAAIERARP